tara:strand:+ start:327 stop:557 length:231 start_codon:yes stop_codon:yes gene_type:complete
MAIDREPIHTSWEIGYEKEGALDYFHDGSEGKYLDENKYKLVITQGKEITDEDDEARGLKDYEWEVEVFLREKNNG